MVGSLVLTTLLLIGPGRPALAQTSTETARTFIERTRQILEGVRDDLRDVRRARAADEAERALALAWDHHHKSEQLLLGGRPAQAVAMSTRAREEGLGAGRLARRAPSANEQAQQRYDRVQEYLDTLADRAKEAENAEAQRFVAEAARKLRRAHENYLQKHFDVASDLIESAESLLNRAARLLFEQGGAPRLQRDLERTTAIVERSREQAKATRDQGSLDTVERAQAALDQAREALVQGEPVRAMRLAGEARRLAARAESMLEGEPAPTAVRDQISRWDSRRGEIDARAQHADDKRVMALIDQAAGHRNKAADLLESRHLEESLRHIKIAHDLLTQAAEHLK